MKFFAKSRTISLLIGLVILAMVVPGAVSAYDSTLAAQYISDTIPATMNTGQSYPVSVTIKNNGSMTWNEASMIRLGGVGDGSGDAYKFGPARIRIPPGTNVLPGAKYTFFFTMTAPATPGTYTPSYRMVWEWHQWFGARLSHPIQVVKAGSSSQLVPHAQFTASTLQGKSPLTVQFTDQSTGAAPLTYQWDFSDDIGSTAKNPSWDFWTEKTYTVTLKVTNAYGSDTIVKQNYITVGSSPTKSIPTTTPTPSLTVTSPNGGESLVRGTNPAIRWTSSGSAGSYVKIELLKAGAIVQTISSSTANDGSYSSWNIPTSLATGTDYKIRVTSTTYKTITDTGNSNFAITSGTTTPTSSLTVTSPNGGETWARGTTKTITWSYTGSPGSTVKIVLLKGGTEVGTISTSTSIGSNGKGSYSWPISTSGMTGSDFKVSVQSISQPAIKDMSNNYITINSGTPSKLPTAQFTANITQGKYPLAVQFTDKSSSAGTTSYAWDVNNDGITEYTVKNPVHTFRTAGTFTVKLTVTNASGSDSESKTSYITATSLPALIPVGNECFGAEACNPTANPIGGGAGYTRIISETDNRVKYVVSTKDQLITAMKSAQSGDVVFVKGTAVIDMSGTPGVAIPAGVTLASNRGLGGSSGALIKKNHGAGSSWCEPLFVTGNGVRITGLRLEGEMRPQDDTSVSESRYLVGIHTHNALEVDNCEIRGWSWAGIQIESGTGTIHHNFIHHNQARGEGYGVSLVGGNALIEANNFDYNRHSVTAAGITGEQYEARYNHVLGHGNAIGASHFDVHENANGGTYSGYSYKIHHNTIETVFTSGAVYAIGFQGGLPESGIWIDHNIIEWADSWSDRPVFQYASSGNSKTHVTQNMVGIPPTLKSGPTGVIRYYSGSG